MKSGLILLKRLNREAKKRSKEGQAPPRHIAAVYAKTFVHDTFVKYPRIRRMPFSQRALCFPWRPAEFDPGKTGAVFAFPYMYRGMRKKSRIP